MDLPPIADKSAAVSGVIYRNAVLRALEAGQGGPGRMEAMPMRALKHYGRISLHCHPAELLTLVDGVLMAIHCHASSLASRDDRLVWDFSPPNYGLARARARRWLCNLPEVENVA